MGDNKQRFIDRLTMEYEYLFANDSEYSYSAAHITPKALAEKMTAGLITGGANKDGAGIRRTCKALGIDCTYKAIKTFLGE